MSRRPTRASSGERSGRAAFAGRAAVDQLEALVLKHTLTLDPWIDVLLGRVPHSFIDPGRHGPQAIAPISVLAAGMGDRDALVIFPEGGNFTPGGRGRARQAARLGHVLAPRPAGMVSAIDAAPHADLVIVAHTGLGHLDSAAAVWKGIPLRGPCGSLGGGSRPETFPRQGRPHGMAQRTVAAGGRLDSRLRGQQPLEE